MGARLTLRRALSATVALAVVAVGPACTADGGTSGSQRDAGDPGEASSPVGTGSSADPTVGTDHEVDPPGDRTGVLAPPDILVTAPKSLTRETVAAVRRIKGVTSVERLSLSESIIENQSLRVAAVNPATYRNYTAVRGANTLEIWERVAGGELALKSQKKEEVPQDEEGYVKLGAATDAPRVHVGAIAPQAPFIDAVVNQTWVETIGMTPNNALLIRTGATAPRNVRKPIQRLLGRDVSVQLVDLATRRGLDPTAKQVAVVTGTVGDAVGVFRYSVLAGGRIAPDPAWVRTHIATEQVPILGTVTCNNAMLPQLRAALQAVVDADLADEIHPEEYAGCYYPRFIAGTTTLSNHAFGLALDFNVPGNQRGTVGEMHRGVVAIFESWGFAWGGHWSYTDPMHFEMNRLVDPRLVSSRQ